MIVINKNWHLFADDEDREYWFADHADGSYLPLYHTPCFKKRAVCNGIVSCTDINKAVCTACKGRPPEKVRDKVKFLLNCEFDI